MKIVFAILACGVVLFVIAAAIDGVCIRGGKC